MRLLHAATVALAAFLLFLAQPMMGKFVLPRFGGGAGVWAVCLFFFQLGLCAGYLLAHLTTRLRASTQTFLHWGVGLAGLASLSLAPRSTPGVEGSLVHGVGAFLAAGIGLPFVLLASTTPLLQHWSGRLAPGRSPYPLYALSNAGSLAALLVYPLLVEPALTRARQLACWTWAFLVYLLVSGACVLVHARRARARGTLAELAPGARARVGWRRVATWGGLAACGAALLVATTSRLTQFVAPLPFLWVLPLAVYLASFVVAFHRTRWYRRSVLAPLLVVLVLAQSLGGEGGGTPQMGSAARDFWVETALACATLFAACMLCHGELRRRVPPAVSVTAFDLSLAGGGALGGLAVAVVAPLVFDSNFDYHLTLLAAGLAWTACLMHERASGVPDSPPRWAATAAPLLCFAFATAFVLQRARHDPELVSVRRNAYGTLAVFERDRDDPTLRRLQLYSGSTLHGEQYLDPQARRHPTTYFTHHSGIGRVLRGIPLERELSIGVVGLGVGTLAAYGNAGDALRFYELDPAVVRVARDTFHFLADSPAAVQVVLGDARLSLEREDARGFDLLVVDAFQNDAIPLHLLTVEAFEQYLRHLAADGLLAFHASSRFVDLVPPLAALAERFDLEGAWVYCEDGVDGIGLSSTWVVLARGAAALQALRASGAARALPVPEREAWTDDHASLLSALMP